MIFIYLITALIILFVYGANVKNALTIKNSRLLTCHLPLQFHDDKDIEILINKYRKRLNIAILISCLTLFILFFLKTIAAQIMFFVFFLVLSTNLISIFVFNMAVLELKKLQKIKGWSFDSLDDNFKEISPLKESKPLNKIYYIIPLAGLVLINFFLNENFLIPRPIFFVTSFISVFGLCLCGRIYSKLPKPGYLDEYLASEKESLYVRFRVEKFLYIYSLFLLLIYFTIGHFSSGKISIYLYLFMCFLPLPAIIMASLDMRKRTPPIDTTDELDSYDILGYKNPRDQRIFIPSPTSPSNFEINRGNLLGRFIFYLTNAIFILLLLAMPYLLIPSNYTYDIKADEFFVEAKFYSDSVKFDDILELEFLDTLPRGSYFRDSGFSDENQSFGNFSRDNKEKLRMYIYNDNESCLLIKRKNAKTLIINEKNKEATKRLYEDLKFKMQSFKN